MKLLFTMLLLCVALSYIEAGTVKEDFRAIAEKCRAETGATEDDIKAMFSHKPLTTTEAKCMRACAMKNGGLVDEEGNFNMAGFDQLIKLLADGNEEKESAAKEIIEECTKIELPEDHCEAAETFAVCLQKLGEEKGLTSMELE